MDDYISRQEMLAELKAKRNAMNEVQLYNNAQIAQRMMDYVESFPAVKEPVQKRACWMDGEVPNNVFLIETWCPICGEMAMYPEDEDRPLETPFCPYCGTIMDNAVHYDSSWPFYEMPKKRMKKKQKDQSQQR